MLREVVTARCAEVSASVVYRSGAAFNRTFRRVEGPVSAKWHKGELAVLASFATVLIGLDELSELKFSGILM